MSTEIDMDALGEKVIDTIKTVYDPEIPIDIYELGLIYDVFINEERQVKILMTLTSPNCPVAESMPAEVEQKIKLIPEVTDVEVEMTFDPAWNQDLISEVGRFELGLL